MKFILYMAITTNGYIATKDGLTPWSEEELKEYLLNIQKCDCLVIGRRTFDLTDKKQLDELKIPVLVLSRQSFSRKRKIVFMKSIKEVVGYIKRKKLNIIMVAGGGLLNNEFMKRNLIDEVYLDIEPFIFGSGISLFMSDNYQYKLALLGTKRLSKNSLQLHYKVIK